MIGYSSNFGLVLRRLIENHKFLDVLITLFQLLMFIMELQGEAKGLSIGGLTVYTKSLSILVKYMDLLYYSPVTDRRAKSIATTNCRTRIAKGIFGTVIIVIHRSINCFEKGQ